MIASAEISMVETKTKMAIIALFKVTTARSSDTLNLFWVLLTAHLPRGAMAIADMIRGSFIN
jgi:hypothetical protein